MWKRVSIPPKARGSRSLRYDMPMPGMVVRLQLERLFEPAIKA
jgi:hypothetical protein